VDVSETVYSVMPEIWNTGGRLATLGYWNDRPTNKILYAEHRVQIIEEGRRKLSLETATESERNRSRELFNQNKTATNVMCCLLAHGNRTELLRCGVSICKELEPTHPHCVIMTGDLPHSLTSPSFLDFSIEALFHLLRGTDALSESVLHS